ncbi:MAG: TonB-dependent receptor [Woeseiaceae bacterium]
MTRRFLPVMGDRLVSAIITLTKAMSLIFLLAPAHAQEDGFIDIDEFLALEEVFISAQRRDEKLQDVPISVTAIQGDRLEAMLESGEDIRALATRAPSLYAESSNGRLGPRFYIRGLGNTDFDLAASQPVSIIMDEVVQENVILKSFPLFDIERVEVLRGPQGTLFGRNTPAGIVKFKTRKPSKETDSYFAASAGSLGTYNFEGATGGSLNAAKTITGRVSILSQNREDWIDNAFTGNDDALGGFNEFAWRAQLEFAPSQNFTALVNLHGRDNDGTASVFRANIVTPGSNSLNVNYDRDTVFFDEGNNNPQEAQAFGGSAKLDFNFVNGLTLTSITAYETVETNSLGDIDGGNGTDFLPDVGPCPPVSTPSCIPFSSQTQDGLDDLDQWTQEFRLATNEIGRVFWQAGVFLFESEFTVTTTPFFVPSTTLTHENSAWAVFGQLSYDLSDEFTVIGGLRYTDDEKDLAVQASPIPTAPVHVHDEQISWDISGIYTVSDTLNWYGRVASGFRAPTIQGRDIAFFGVPSIARSEEIVSVEVGFKATLADERVRLNSSIYHYRVDDMQFSAIGGAANLVQLVNAERGIGKGIDVDLEWLLSDGLMVTAGFSYNDTELDDPNLRIAPCGSGLCTVMDALDANGNVIVDGNAFPQAPKLMANVILEYIHEIGNDNQIFVDADYAYQGETSFFLYESLEYNSDSTFELGLRAGLRLDDGRWELAIFGRNITDEENLIGGIDFNNLTGYDNDPAVYGVTVKGVFGQE